MIRGFSQPLILEANDDLNGAPWLVGAPFDYLLEPYENPLYRVVVRRGTGTDLASVPVLRPDRRTRKPAAIHDELYRRPFIYGVTDEKRFGISRRKADRIFLEAMIVAKVPAYKRQVYYRAVRIFGGGRWRKLRGTDALMHSIKRASIR